MASLALVFDILAKDNASSTFRNVGNAAERVGQQAENALKRVNTGFESVQGVLKGFLGAGLILGFKALYDAAAESARIGRLTEAVLKSTGGAANVTAKQVSALATAISNKTGIDDEAIQSGENLLLTFTNIRNEAGKGNDVFNQATSIINDMSVALGQDMKSSAIQVGKALNDPIKGVTALTRVGVSFTQAQKDQIGALVESGHAMDAQKIILAELTKEFGGAAAAAATPFDKLKVNLGNLAEQIGGYLIPVVNDLATFFIHDLLPTAQKLGDVAGGILGPALHVVGTALKDIWSVASGIVGFFASLPAPIQAGAIALGAIAALKGPVSSVLETVALKGLYLKDAFAGISLSMGGLKAAGSGLMGLFGGPWGLAITGATVGLSLLFEALGTADEATKKTTQATQDYASALKSANGAINDSVRAAAAKAAQDAGLLDVAEKLGIALPTVTDAITHQGSSLESTRSQLEQYIQAHVTRQAVVNSEGEITYTRALDDQGRAAQGALSALNSLSGQTVTTAGDEGQLAAATGTASGAAQQLATDLQDTADAASAARTQADLFKTSLDVLTGQNVSLLDVQAHLYDALLAAKDAMKAQGGAVLDAAGALNLHSENGRKAFDILNSVRDAGNQYIATLIQQGASTADVNAADAQLRKSFIETANQMGISGQDAENLANLILGIPAERTTTINADTRPAELSILGLINRKWVATVAVNAAANIAPFLFKAAGGLIEGAGNGTSDSILAAVSDGEFIVKASQTAKHRALLEAINQGRGFAAGGYVGPESMTIGTALDQAQATAALAGGVNALAAQMGKFASNAMAQYAPNPGGSGVERWRPLVMQVLASLGLGGAYANGVLNIIKFESGGNPNAINLWDSNAKAGHPSQGLMQTIPGTFAAYAGPYRPLGITNPLANIYAGTNYALHRYGAAWLARGGNVSKAGGYSGYDSGGLLMPGMTLAYNGTGKPETVRTAEQEAALGAGMVGMQIAGTLDLGGGMEARMEAVVVGAMNAQFNRGEY